MRFEVEAGGQSRTVDVAADGLGWRVRIEGRVWRASMVRSGERWSLLLAETGNRAQPGHDKAGVPLEVGRSYDVMFEPAPEGAWRVHVNGRVIPAGLRTTARRMGRRPGGHSVAGAAESRVVAPMPGRVVKVLVAPGAVVEARQGVVVVEAMKMENELRAPRGGTVREVCVAEGASVEAQTVLVVIE